jgi:hypothetical protein
LQSQSLGTIKATLNFISQSDARAAICGLARFKKNNASLFEGATDSGEVVCNRLTLAVFKTTNRRQADLRCSRKLLLRPAATLSAAASFVEATFPVERADVDTVEPSFSLP